MKNFELLELFKVEYDKQTEITSYPSFINSEIDFWLNKAYNILVNQKFTGNNARRVGIEGDSKRISDLQNLIVSDKQILCTDTTTPANTAGFVLPQDPKFLFFIAANAIINKDLNNNDVVQNAELITHNQANKAVKTNINNPLLLKPCITIDENKLTLFYDNFQRGLKPKSEMSILLTYVKEPNKISNITEESKQAIVEVSDNMCYDIVNLAVTIALENTESMQRVQAKSAFLNIQE